MRVGVDVDPASRGQRLRTEVVGEDERSDHPATVVGQQALDGAVAHRALAGFDHQLDGGHRQILAPTVCGIVANSSLSLPTPPATIDELMDALVEQLPHGADVVVPIANGEPVRLIDALEDRADRLTGVQVHQMHALRDRPYLHGAHRGHLEHVSWFLSHVTRPAFAEGGCRFLPAHFSEIPRLLLEKDPFVVLAASSPPDRFGYFSLGVSADYSAALIGRVPFVLEVNEAMPRTHGENRLHRSDVAGWVEATTDLVEVATPEPDEVDRTIARHVVERIARRGDAPAGHRLDPDRRCDVPPRPPRPRRAHRAPVLPGGGPGRGRGGDRDPQVHLPPADHRDVRAGDPAALRLLRPERRGRSSCPSMRSPIPAPSRREDGFVSVNATLEVDLFGQCASETLGTRYWSGSGGQADFARGAQYSRGGEGFVVLRSTTRDPDVSRVVPSLQRGAVVTTLKNTVDNVVTEHGVAELRGRTLDERAAALISIAAPQHRERLAREAHAMGLQTRP